MFGPGTFLGDLIKTIAGNKFYLVITTAICTILVMPLIKYIAQSIWKGLNKLRTKLSRNWNRDDLRERREIRKFSLQMGNKCWGGFGIFRYL